jgi:putative solute:sodium symporter small subunit
VPRSTPESNASHWFKTRNLTFLVLFLWLIFAFAVHIFAQYLNQITFLGFPLGYYMAVQGSLIAFVVIIFFQNDRQDAIDDDHGHGH